MSVVNRLVDLRIIEAISFRKAVDGIVGGGNFVTTVIC